MEILQDMCDHSGADLTHTDDLISVQNLLSVIPLCLVVNNYNPTYIPNPADIL